VPEEKLMSRQPWTLSRDEILEDLSVAAEKGLGIAEVRTRRRRHGPNRLREHKRKSAWGILTDQFKSLILLLLAVAATLSFAFGEIIEGLAIVMVVAINAAIGFLTEFKAVRSMEALRRLGGISAKVRRQGQVREIPAVALVPGDIVILEGGDIVTADLRLTQASKLQADESALTGESVPVSKAIEPLAAEALLAERANMLFKGTAVTRGSGEAVVVATGMQTELGRISSLVEEAKEESTPLEKRLDQLGHKLIWVTLITAALVAVMGILAGKEIFLMMETAIALAVAAIPEGLPIVATIALARGMRRMARRNALVNRLSAVETLGATNLICADKTGTLTENRMTLTRIAQTSGEVEICGQAADGKARFTRGGQPIDPLGDRAIRQALETGVLCNNASLRGEKEVGDPLEVALLAAAIQAGLSPDRLREQMPEAREEAFDPEVKMMATFHETGDGYRVAVKGAPEPILEASFHILTDGDVVEMSSENRRQWLERNDQMAEEGLRVLALATKTVASVDSKPYETLTFLGLIGLQDPPHKDTRQAIEQCHEAGVRVIMITGDQPVTARNIGLAVGLVDEKEAQVFHGKDLKSPQELSEEERRHILSATLFARVSPKQKLDLIDLHQKNGAIVAMTGDGVNDAPALKEADIGVAMGLRGTQVAREAADMVLKDDRFSTIVAAVKQGRVIFDNIRKFVLYLISCNVSEIMAVTFAAAANFPLPILPLQILFLNLVTDVFPALALGVGEGDPDVMKRPSRSSTEPILSRQHWLAIGGYGLVMTFSVLGALALALTWLRMDPSQAVTVSFLTLALAQLWHVFNMRDRGSRFFRNDMTQNPYVWGALGLCTALLLVAVYLPGLSDVLKLTNPGIKGWILIVAMSLIPWVIGQISKTIPTKTARSAQEHGTTIRVTRKLKSTCQYRAKCR
jgi:Ca2+-transporting ATPase